MRPTVPEARLQASGLYKSFGAGQLRVPVLKDVSLDLTAGQLTLIMGPSGCGKSTLLAILSGLLHPDQGRVCCLGEDIWQLSDTSRRRFRQEHFGFIFQAHNLFPVLTAREQLEMVARWGDGLTPAQAHRRVEEVLQRLDLSTRGDLLPAALSGGEKQRVAIGRALIKGPHFCFADEPTSALDWSHGRQVIELLQAQARQHNGLVVVVTHDPRLLPFADEVFHLDDGRIVEHESRGSLPH
jgi:putative ABC transport system ATP-binding protein